VKNIHKYLSFLIGVTVALALAAVMLLSFRAFGLTERAVEARRHISLVISRTEALLAEVRDAESYQRGYALTGDEAFLESYAAARDGMNGRLEELRRITLIVAARGYPEALSPLLAAKFAEMSRVIELRRNNDLPAAVAAVSGGEGKRIMDSIMAVGSSYIQLEQGALARNEEGLKSGMRELFLAIVCASALTILLGLLFAWLSFREAGSKLRVSVLRETQRLLELQRETNENLQRANAMLQVSEEKFAVTINSIGDAVMATDAEGRVTLLNPVAERLTGWTQEEAAGHAADEVFRIINQDTRRSASVPIKRTLEHGTIQGLANHTILVARSGEERSISDSCAPIRSREGEVIGAVLVFRDVTDEYAAREYSESIINTVREPLITLDQDLRVVSVGRSFYEVFKVKPEETVGQLIYDLGNKQWDIPKLRELLETILPQKASFDDYVVEHDFATIGRRIMLLNARQIQRGIGKERIILLAIEDITERREIETGLEKAHSELGELATELKRAARIKNEFLANMSHELRTPLNSINGFSEVLYDESFGALNEKQKKYIKNVMTSGKHLLLLINQILDMAKVEAGKMTLTLSSISPSNTLNEISRLVADMVSKKKLHIALDIAEDLPEIEADELKVKEILYNLLANAVKFTPEGGSIELRATKTDTAIEITIRDTGVGIAAENLLKVFEGFFRVDTPYSRLTEGTGLGLPLSKKMVELHGGELFIESEGLHKGTTVRFTLPILSRKAA
jgi:two-component system cell cycle sensor histidine kinase PleC